MVMAVVNFVLLNRGEDVGTRQGGFVSTGRRRRGGPELGLQRGRQGTTIRDPSIALVVAGADPVPAILVPQLLVVEQVHLPSLDRVQHPLQLHVHVIMRDDPTLLSMS